MIEELKSVKKMFDTFEDLSLGYVPSQIEVIEHKISVLEKFNPKGKENEILNSLTQEERHAVIKAYCFTTAHRNHKFLFLRIDK